MQRIKAQGKDACKLALKIKKNISIVQKSLKKKKGRAFLISNLPLAFIRLSLKPLGQCQHKDMHSFLCLTRNVRKKLSKLRVPSVQLNTNFGIIVQFNGKLEMTGFPFSCHASVSISHTGTPGHLVFSLKMSCYTGSCSALVQPTKRFVSRYAIALQGNYGKTSMR